MAKGTLRLRYRDVEIVYVPMNDPVVLPDRRNPNVLEASCWCGLTRGLIPKEWFRKGTTYECRSGCKEGTPTK